jgi:hypothetical protein
VSRTRTVSRDITRAQTRASHRSRNMSSRLSKSPKELELCPKWVSFEWREGELKGSDMSGDEEEADDGEEMSDDDSDMSVLARASELGRSSRNWATMCRVRAHFC